MWKIGKEKIHEGDSLKKGDETKNHLKDDIEDSVHVSSGIRRLDRGEPGRGR
jgi:hypothetical protein